MKLQGTCAAVRVSCAGRDHPPAGAAAAGAAAAEVRSAPQGRPRHRRRRTGSARSATSPSRTARSRRSPPASIRPTRSRSSTSSGLYVTPGLVDIHVHVYAGTGERGSYAGDNSVYPDGFTLRSGVTTVADAGCAGWRNFEDFKERIIDRSKTRVLAFLNIVGNGMRGGKFEQDLNDMEAKPTADMALRYKGLIVGIKTAHYTGPEWTPVERAVEAGTIANIPVMVDFGANRPERPLSRPA